MALKVKAVERLLKFDKNDPGSYKRERHPYRMPLLLIT